MFGLFKDSVRGLSLTIFFFSYLTKLNYAGELCNPKKLIITKNRKLLRSETGGSEHLDLSSIPTIFCPNSNLSWSVLLSTTSWSQNGLVLPPVEAKDPVNTVCKPWLVFLEKRRDSSVLEIQLLEDRRGLPGTVFKGKRLGLGNYKSSLVFARTLFIKLLLFVWCLDFKYESQYGVFRNDAYQISLVSSFGGVTGLQKMDTADVICLTSVRLLSSKLKQIMRWRESRLLEKVDLEWLSIISK